MKNLYDVTLSPPTFPQADTTGTINVHDIINSGSNFITMKVLQYADNEVGDKIIGYLYLNDGSGSVIKSLPYYITPNVLDVPSYKLLFPIDEISTYGKSQVHYEITSNGNMRKSPNVNINLVYLDEKKFTITPSIPDHADVLAGQVCLINVSIHAKNELDLINLIYNDIEIKIDSGFSRKQILKPFLPYDNNPLLGVLEVMLTVKELPDVHVGDKITYTVQILDKNNLTGEPIQQQTFTYNVRNIDKKAVIVLNADNEFISPPTVNNPVGTGNSYVTYYSSPILSDDKKPLKNTQILIYSKVKEKLYPINRALVLIGTEPQKSGVQSKSIYTDRINDVEFFTVNTDEHGIVRFRVYPRQEKTGRVDFLTNILSVTNETYAGSIYIYNSDVNTLFGPNPPDVWNVYPGGVIARNPGEKVFKVNIDRYDNYQHTDSIIFFINASDDPKDAIKLNPIQRINNDIDFGSYPFHFSYDQIPLNKVLSFYYLIAPIENASLTSNPTDLFYVGTTGGDGDDDRDDGIYNRVSVYSSYSPLPFDPATGDKVGNITYNTISQQRPKDDVGITVTTPTGLYVVIKGTDNTTRDSKGLPPLGSQGTLYMEFQDPNDNPSKKYQFQIPSENDPGHKDYALIEIPYCDLTRVRAWHSGAESKIHFKYTINVSGKDIPSKTWIATCITVLPGLDINDYDGCPKSTNYSN
ncbi:hypothetical protein [Xenorhabdus cabanillasii]|uniref:Uncharacterized protein n=1 Tax=Xenorhabdus cabanillasii JM26 TaxID=1427517 RepID=W1J668_9GAMM|nr:hypothetical protein [Xenorhabdus cabanillasii]PHM75674.1 hypothetical protein Xcab_03837 [Xenorhabdus cabanillasii JM26]CDL86252.1 hypothetical protein XCR1_2900004 [Xenorhabdus cabanillasii JM26]